MTANRSSQSRFRPNFDTLETRDMMSVASAVVDAGVLKVTLDNGNDYVLISESLPTFQTVSMAAKAAPAGSLATTTQTTVSPMILNNANIGAINFGTITVTDATRNGVSWTFNRSAVKSILIENHNSFGDTNTIISKSSLPTVVDLRNSSGTNHVETGAGNDIVYGSEGNDNIWTNAGNDIVYGFGGDDRIDTGLGSDSAFGGIGNDTLLDTVFSSDTNLLYGEAGNDRIFSNSKNDVVDGGTEIDTANVRTGTWIVRNVESVFITNVPTGNAVTTYRQTARQAANRFLGAWGLPLITHGIVLDDSQAGLSSSRMVSLVRESKPDATLVTGAYPGGIIYELRMGKPVIARFGGGWAVFTGYNAATNQFTYIGMSGQPQTITLSAAKRDIIY